MLLVAEEFGLGIAVPMWEIDAMINGWPAPPSSDQVNAAEWFQLQLSLEDHESAVLTPTAGQSAYPPA